MTREIKKGQKIVHIPILPAKKHRLHFSILIILTQRMLKNAPDNAPESYDANHHECRQYSRSCKARGLFDNKKDLGGKQGVAWVGVNALES